MSATRTDNRITSAVLTVLSDYELHHSATEDTAPPPNTHPLPAAAQHSDENPPDWDTAHRRVPAYRPINYELDQSQRQVYQNPAERVFITLMFAGLRLNVVSGGDCRVHKGCRAEH